MVKRVLKHGKYYARNADGSMTVYKVGDIVDISEKKAKHRAAQFGPVETVDPVLKPATQAAQASKTLPKAPMAPAPKTPMAAKTAAKSPYVTPKKK